MVNLHKTLLVYLIFLLAVSIIVYEVKAQENQIEAKIFPSEGTATTDILIRFITRNVSIGNVEKADIFWDDSSIALNEQGVQGADGSYNYHLLIPPEPPFSDIGNHTIRVDSSVSNYGGVSFNFTFTVTEYVPSPEYVALLATYSTLLNNYTSLMDNYNLLHTDYAALSDNYTALLAGQSSLFQNYTLLLVNYNTLLGNFNSLSASYYSLSANFENLQSLYIRFVANYTNMQGNFDSLSSNYNTLRANYDSLNSSYLSLKSNYDGLHGQIALNTNLNYALITSTIVLAVVVVYLVMRKQKPTTKTRY
jgi:hypothetical protein